jgi:glycerophosphoryl diester phosphodiesterase
MVCIIPLKNSATRLLMLGIVQVEGMLMLRQRKHLALPSLIFILLLTCIVTPFQAALSALQADSVVEPEMEIVAHRGASWDAPENTLSAFNLAWKQGADAIELDVMMSKDGRIVVIHDKDTKRLAGVDRLVSEQTLIELRNLDVGRRTDEKSSRHTIPLLGEVLETIPLGKRALIEIKCGKEILPELVREIKQSKKGPEQTAIIGFSSDVMEAAKEALPELDVYWIVNIKPDAKSAKKPLTVDELIKTCKRIKVDGLDLSACDTIDKRFVDRVHDVGLGLAVWTVNDPVIARKMRDAGVDCLTTDRPSWIREQLAEVE